MDQEMEYAFLFATRTVDVPGNPLTIKGATLDEGFDPKALDRQVSPSWHTPVYSVHYPPEQALAFPDELWLNTGERKLDFDIRLDMHGILFSDRFARTAGAALEACFKVARLNIVNRKGRDNAARPMFYGKPLRPRPVVDEEASRRETEMVQAGYLSLQQNQIRHLALLPDLADPFISPIDLEQCLLVEETMAASLAGLTGAEIVSAAAFPDRYNCRNSFITRDGAPAIG